MLYHGHDVYARATNRVEVRRRIGMVFQRPNPFPKSIYDNVAWAPRNLGMKKDLDERVERALRGAALWGEVKDRLKVSALSLSGGQQQRLCIARAIAVEPDVLLLDEPASALDPVATASIEDLMHELKHRYTIVIVTHNMQQAARVADRTAFFSLDPHERVGTLVEYDDTSVIFSNPATPGHATTSRAGSASRPGLRQCDALRTSAIESGVTWASSGWPHCQQNEAPVLCGAPQLAHAPAMPVSSRRRMRSTSLSSASASWSTAARWTSTSTRIRLRMAIS